MSNCVWKPSVRDPTQPAWLSSSPRKRALVARVIETEYFSIIQRPRENLANVKCSSQMLDSRGGGVEVPWLTGCGSLFLDFPIIQIHLSQRYMWSCLGSLELPSPRGITYHFHLLLKLDSVNTVLSLRMYTHTHTHTHTLTPLKLTFLLTQEKP